MPLLKKPYSCFTELASTYSELLGKVAMQYYKAYFSWLDEQGVLAEL